jgi:hypothetical protein
MPRRTAYLLSQFDKSDCAQIDKQVFERIANDVAAGLEYLQINSNIDWKLTIISQY